MNNEMKNMIDDLRELIAIKSVLGKSSVGMPFGEGPKMALDWFLSKAREYGLQCGQLDGYCGWAEYGEGETCVGALCHLDVVPAENDWQTDPFCLEIKDGKLLGRGVADDKGAAIMCLHALKQLKDSGFVPKKRLRVIVGLNEENGSACIKHYVEHGEIPECSFVPDSEFPVINSEKGILHLKVQLELDKFFKRNIAHISGGKTINVIPNEASVSIFKDSPLGQRLMGINNGCINNDLFTKTDLAGGILAFKASLDQFSVSEKEDIITITASGKAGHALNPKKGDNAIWKIFMLLDLLSEGESKITPLMCEYICNHSCCERLDIYKDDEDSGDTTMSMGIVDIDDNNMYFTLDLRLPICLKPEEVKRALNNVLPAHSRVDTMRYAPNLFVDKNSELVSKLLSVYSLVTNTQGFCIKSGGGTYARELPNAVAFGPVFYASESNLHKADEFLTIENFEQAFKIYMLAFKKLSE